MRKAISNLARLLDTVQRRFQRSRAGSVMILVVTLLVLMAIIGTAFLTTARNDRYSSQLHESNVQVDMLLEGVKNIILGRMAGENFLDPNGQRWDDVHSDNWLASRTPTYMVDACGVYNPQRNYSRGEWVQDPTTTPVSFYVSVADNNLGNPLTDTNHWLQDSQATPSTPCWEAISSLFDLVPGVGVSAEDIRGSVVAGIPGTFDGSRGRNLVQLVFTTPTGPAGSLPSNGQYYPALRYFRPGNPNDNPPTKDTFVTTIAASASGNGIADSFLWRLPMGELNGVTYYAAVRVIDNNAAINLNTAGSSLYDYDAQGNPLPNMGFFPGNVGLAELLYTFNPSATNFQTLGQGPPQEFSLLTQYRDGVNALPDGIISLLNPNNPAGPTQPIWDFQGSYGQRPDFRYLSVADAQFMGLGRRIDLPGRSTQSGTQFTSFSWGDSAALANRFDLVSSATVQSNGTGGGSTAENVLAPTLWKQNYYRTTPWDPSPTNPPYTFNWFQQNYAYTKNPSSTVNDVIVQGSAFNLSNTFNRRPLVVARNPQSNLMPVHVPEMDALASSSPLLAAAMGYNYDPNSPDPARGNMPGVALNTAIPLITSAPQQVGVSFFGTYSTDVQFAFNTANPPTPVVSHLPTLWMGFYNAMLPALEPPYTDHTLFVDRNFQAPGATSSTSFFTVNNQPLQLAQQFRSSLRDPTGIGPYVPNRRPPNITSTENNATTWLPPSSELLVRSLIAAANAQDIRDSDDNVSSATVSGLPVMSNSALLDGGAKLTVYGAERQPFITEVFVDNDTSPQPATFGSDANGNPLPNNVSNGMSNPVPYVAVELYNPYDQPISLANWTLAAASRAGFPAMSLRLLDVNPTFATSPPTIPARGFLVLESVDIANNAAAYRPWWAYAGTTVNNVKAAADADRATPKYLVYYVKGLDLILNDPTAGTADELYLLRPRLANGTLSQSLAVGSRSAGYFFNEGSLADMVPVDSFDFSGMSKSADNKTFQAWHYVRGNTIYTDVHPFGANPQVNPPRPSWKFVFGGHWDPALQATTVTGTTITQPPQPPPAGTVNIHEDGVVTGGTWVAGAQVGGVDPWILNPPGFVANGAAGPPPDGPTAPIQLGFPDFASSYDNPYPGIPLNNTGYGNAAEVTGHGINKSLTTNGFNSYPFGGIARNGDLLQVPFIGSYTITYNGAIVEMNPITKDAGFADDNNLNYIWDLTNVPPLQNAVQSGQVILGLNEPRTIAPNSWTPVPLFIQLEDNEEQVGRFVPLSSVDGDPKNFLPVYSLGNPYGTYPPLATTGYSIRSKYKLPDGSTTTEVRLFDTYGWSSRVFDYFSAAQTPNDDYLPNSKPEYYANYDPNAGTYTPALPGPWKVANSPAGASTPNSSSEAAAPIEGLININTASWKVLAELPFFALSPQVNSPGLSTNSAMLTANIDIAQAIVRYRNAFGPFHSIFDLNRVIDPYVAMAVSTYDPKLQIFQCQGQTTDGQGPPDSTDYQSYQGVLTPNLPGFINDGGAKIQTDPTDSVHLPDGLISDFSQREAQVMRLSNLITTRSDSFTVYLQIQGWRGAGTPTAQLVVQRRAAFIMDRSGSTRTADNRSQTTNVISVNIPTKVQTQ